MASNAPVQDDQPTPGRRLRSRRALKGLYQEDVAMAAGIGVTRLSALENDKYGQGVEKLSVGKLVSLCGVLGCSLDYIVHGETTDAAR